MTDQELIKKLQTLKQIKPKQDWVVLTKNQLISSLENKAVAQRTAFSDFLTVLFQKKFAYAFAVFLLLFVGLSGFVNFFSPAISEQSTLVAENAIKSNVETFKMRSQNLAIIAKNTPAALPEALKEVKKEAKSLTAKIQKHPSLAMEFAFDINDSRTYLDVAGTETMKETDDLYGVWVDILLADAEKISWTDAQKAKLAEIQQMRKEGKNSAAFESYMLLSAPIQESAEKLQDDLEDSQKSENTENNESVKSNPL